MSKESIKGLNGRCPPPGMTRMMPSSLKRSASVALPPPPSSKRAPVPFPIPMTSQCISAVAIILSSDDRAVSSIGIALAYLLFGDEEADDEVEVGEPMDGADDNSESVRIRELDSIQSQTVNYSDSE